MKRFLLLLLLSVPVFLLAQSAMSLDDCIRLAYKQNPAVRNGVIGIKETKVDYIASVGAFLPHIVVNAETGKRFGRSLDPDTNGYTSESFEEGTVGLDMTLSLFEGFSRINQVRFRKMNKERSEWELKEKQNELAYQVTDAYYKLILERKLLDLALEQSRLSERYLKQTEVFVELGLKSASDLQEVKARREGDIYRYQSRENSSRIALLHLKQLMNIQPGDTLAILDTITASQLPPYSVSTVETLYAQSIEILPSIRMIDLKQKAAHKEYAIAGGAFSPSVFARFTVGSNYYNTAFSARQLRFSYFGSPNISLFICGLFHLVRHVTKSNECIIRAAGKYHIHSFHIVLIIFTDFDTNIAATTFNRITTRTRHRRHSYLYCHVCLISLINSRVKFCFT